MTSRRYPTFSLNRIALCAFALSGCAANANPPGPDSHDHSMNSMPPMSPGHAYTLSLAASSTAPFGHRDPLVMFKTNVAGAQVVQAIAPLRRVLGKENNVPAGPEIRRFILVGDSDTDAADLIRSSDTP
jgi:hypothetical protein